MAEVQVPVEEAVQPLVKTLKDKQKASSKPEVKPTSSPTVVKPLQPEQEVKVIPFKERQTCRCKICGQFLFEISTKFAVVRARCRRTECKMVNIVTIEDDTTTYRTEEKESKVKY